MPTEELSGPVGFEWEARSTEREPEARSKQEFKLDLDEELVEENEAEPIDENQGRRYPLRNRKLP